MSNQTIIRTRHSGGDCRSRQTALANPEAKDGNTPTHEHPCNLDSGNPCRNDGLYPKGVA